MTITATPTSYNSVHGDVIYTVSDPHTADPATYPNYKFVGDVYIDSTLVARIKKVPDPITKIGIFNIGQIIRNYITVVFDPMANTVYAQRFGPGDFKVEVTMKFGEEYGFDLFLDIVTDNPRTYFNNYNSRPQSESSLVSVVDKIASDRPLINTIKCDSQFNLVPFLTSSTDEMLIEIRAYDGNGDLVGSVSTGTDSPAGSMVVFNFSRQAINFEYPGTITDVVKYYTVQVVDSILQFNVDCECIYDVSTLHFLNKYGGFESKDFTKVSRKTISIERKDFGKLAYTVDAEGQVSYKTANNVYNESRSVYSSLFKEKMTLNSDLLTDEEYRWLEQLIVSPMVYIEEGGSFYPVVITDNNYEPKKYINDDLTNLTLNIEYGDQQNAQFR